MWIAGNDYSNEFATFTNKEHPYEVAVVTWNSPPHKICTLHLTAFPNHEITWVYIYNVLYNAVGQIAAAPGINIVSMIYHDSLPSEKGEGTPNIEVKIIVPNDFELHKTGEREQINKESILYQIEEIRAKLDTLETYIERVL